MNDMAEDPEGHRFRTKERLWIVEGVARAIAFGPELVAAVDEATDRQDALRVLGQPPFNLEQIVAHYVLDMPIGQRTELARRALAEEADSLRSLLENDRDDM